MRNNLISFSLTLYFFFFKGYSLSRRERNQLKRTAIDILRVGPLAMFIIVPGMELVLPFAVKAFPNMLPSTFRETLKTQEGECVVVLK